MRSLLIAIGLACLVVPAEAEDKCVALTLDDGPSAEYTGRVLDVLSGAGVKATFFVVGQRVVENRALVRRMREEGHEIGNHSFSHPWLSHLSLAAAARQITQTDEAVVAITGVRPRVVRAPYGDLPNDLRVVGGGRPFIGWSNDTSDYAHPSQSTIVRRATGGGRTLIVLMHDIHRWSLAAMPGVVAGLKARGYRFVTVTELLEGACGFTASPNLVFGPSYIPRRFREVSAVRRTD